MAWLLLIPAIYLLLLLAVAWFSLHPLRIPIFLSPGGLGAPQEEVEFESQDGTRLRGWWVEAENARVVAVLSHGYLMNRSELAPVAWTLWKEGISCLLYDFRAHGRSGGRKSFFGLVERLDVAAAVRLARARAPGAKVVLIGSSMGAAASALALSDDPAVADALVLDSAYSRLSEAVIGWWRFLGGHGLAAFLWPVVYVSWPLAGFNPFAVDVADGLRRAGPLPVLIFHGECDTLALPGEAFRNQAACQGPVELIWLADCGHSEGRWLHPERYNAALLDFLRVVAK